MANPLKGEVAFDADDATYTLVFDFNALCTLEDEFGVDVSKIGDAVGAKASNLRTVFRVGLSAHHPEMTDKEVGSIITDIGPTKAGEIITEAFTKSFPAEAARGTARPPKGAMRKTS